MGGMALLFRCIAASTLLLFLAWPARAGVRISIAEDLEPGHAFMVRANIVNSGLDGGHPDPIGVSFLQAGQSETLPVPATLPLVFDQVVAVATHPAFYFDSVSAKTAPKLIRTVSLPPLRPLNWRSLLDSEAPLQERGVGLTAAIVNDHFRMILRDYLPAFDRAGQMENLRRYLPLLRELAAFVHTPAAIRNSLQNLQQASSGDLHHDAESVKRVEGEYRVQLLRRLREIEGWLDLDQKQRRPMHDWIKNFHKPEFVINRIMQDADRQKIFGMLRQSGHPGYMSHHRWINQDTGVSFSFTLTTKSGGKNEHAVRTVLLTDLNPLLGLDGNSAYLRKCFPSFIKDRKAGWQLQ
jgi:hypothetical protein